jgi:hypothetical protein
VSASFFVNKLLKPVANEVFPLFGFAPVGEGVILGLKSLKIKKF